MLRKLLLMLSLALVPVLSSADAVHDTFQGGVLGVRWGTPLQDLVGVYPNGDHVFAVTPGHRGYWVKDGQTFLNVPRERSGVLFGLDERNRVAVAAVAFDYERRLELRDMLTSLLGAPVPFAAEADETRYGWYRDGGMPVMVTELGQAHQQIIWLTIASPGYERAKFPKCEDTAEARR